MIGFVGGLGTKAGMHIVNRWINSKDRTCDSAYPEYVYINVVSNIGVNADIGDEAICKIKKAVDQLKAIGCKHIFVLCNTVHIYYDMWANDCCVNWVKSFVIPQGYKILASVESRVFNLYSGEYYSDQTEVDVIIEHGISNMPCDISPSDTIFNVNAALCCTELSILSQFFKNRVDCADHIVALLHNIEEQSS